MQRLTFNHCAAHGPCICHLTRAAANEHRSHSRCTGSRRTDHPADRAGRAGDRRRGAFHLPPARRRRALLGDRPGRCSRSGQCARSRRHARRAVPRGGDRFRASRWHARAGDGRRRRCSAHVRSAGPGGWRAQGAPRLLEVSIRWLRREQQPRRFSRRARGCLAEDRCRRGDDRRHYGRCSLHLRAPRGRHRAPGPVPRRYPRRQGGDGVSGDCHVRYQSLADRDRRRVSARRSTTAMRAASATT